MVTDPFFLRDNGFVEAREKVGVRGFEPPASTSRTLRATGLRYTPIYLLFCLGSRATQETRTPDPRITNALLYQLS